MDHPVSDESGLQHDPRVLREQIRVLRHQLDEATSKIMSLQSTTDQITDADIRKRFGELRDAIQDWIYGIEKFLKGQSKDFSRTLGCVLEDFDDEYRLEVISELGLYDDTDRDNSAWMEWIVSLNTGIYIVLSRLIWGFLYAKVFSKKYPIGVARDSCLTFAEILSVMRGSGEEDVILMANKWRSNTLTALTKTPDFQRRRTDNMKQLSGGLETVLARFIDHTIPESNYKTLVVEVLQRAIDLHQQISCSSYEYLIIEPKLVRRKPLDESMASSWTLMDIVKWRRPYEEKSAVSHCLYPGIYRKEAEGEENVSVTPPVVLVYEETDSQPPLDAQRPLDPQRPLQSQQNLHQSPKKGSHRSSLRSPDRSNSRPSRSAHPGRRPSTSMGDEGSATTSALLPAALEKIGNFFQGNSSKKPLQDKESPRDRSPHSQEDSGRQDSRSKTPSASSRKQPLKNADRAGKSSKTAKSKPHQRAEPVSESSEPSSPVKTTFVSETNGLPAMIPNPASQDQPMMSFSLDDVTYSKLSHVHR